MTVVLYAGVRVPMCRPFCFIRTGRQDLYLRPYSVFLRTLPRYLTLPLRRAPTCHGNGREPDELTEHHRAQPLVAMPTLLLRFYLEPGNKAITKSASYTAGSCTLFA